MADRYGVRYFKPDEMNFKDHWANDTKWTVNGSHDNIYTVTMTAKGFTCNCTGMSFRGKCKHVQNVADAFINNVDTSTN